MSLVANDLWELTATGSPWIDPVELARAVEVQIEQPELDFRTRLLIRDSLQALRSFWGEEKFHQWMEDAPHGGRLLEILQSALGEPGFPSLQHRIMSPLQPLTIHQFLRELGDSLAQPTRITIGGAVALILSDQLRRNTEDIDVVDEVPPEIRSNHQLLDELAKRYGLLITHFQSHYLPNGWQGRIHALGRFGVLDVDLVDTCDILVGKLFSARTKDLDDLRMLARRLDRTTIESRLLRSASSLKADPNLAANATRNWYILYGDPLPA